MTKKQSPLFKHKILELLASGHKAEEIATLLGSTTRSIRQTYYLMKVQHNARTLVQLVVMYREGEIKTLDFNRRERKKRDVSQDVSGTNTSSSTRTEEPS